MLTYASQTEFDQLDHWAIVQERDARYDGAFVVAVRTTGIYCRPSCPARHPKRENVTFYPTNEAAEAAGFRPCKRCRPNEVDAQVAMVRQACVYLEEADEAAPTLAELGAQLHVSPFHLQRTFKRITGVSPRQYAEQRRLERLKTHLQNGNSVTDAIYNAGYSSPSGLQAEQLGMTPSEYRRGGKGMVIAYSVTECTLGYVLVAGTERGICAVYLGDTPATLEETLRKEYPAAEIHEDEAGLSEWVSAVLEQMDGTPAHAELPLDIHGTAFQRRVWDALRTIPMGSTRTYSEIARSLGQPKAARAVGRACATNPVSIVIPCHRVVREDGELAGYGWGVERKRALLQKEKAALEKMPELA